MKEMKYRTRSDIREGKERVRPRKAQWILIKEKKLEDKYIVELTSVLRRGSEVTSTRFFFRVTEKTSIKFSHKKLVERLDTSVVSYRN